MIETLFQIGMTVVVGSLVILMVTMVGVLIFVVIKLLKDF